MTNVDEFLSHYGRKGMKWGVIRDDDQLSRASSGSKTSTESKSKPKESSVESFKQASASLNTSTKKEQLQKEGPAKQKAKAEIEFPHSTKGVPKDPTKDPVSDLKEGGLSRNQKIALGVGGAIAVAGLAYYGNKHLGNIKAQEALLQAERIKRLKDLPDPVGDAQRKKQDAEMSALFGPNMVPRPDDNRAYGYYAGFQNNRMFDRPEFTIPKSTMFQRLSSQPETGEGYSKGTYASFLPNDNKRYGTSEEFGKKPYVVNFQAKDDIRVPAVSTVLKTMKDLGDPDGIPMSDKDAVNWYRGMSGANWNNAYGQKIIGSLKNQGYSAMVDDMDAGFVGDLPVVFFGEPSNSSARPRTDADRARDKSGQLPTTGRYA